MMRLLEARRQRILRELAHLEREIAATQQRMAEIQIRRTVLNAGKAKAA
jgi:hypothetical protein